MIIIEYRGKPKTIITAYEMGKSKADIIASLLMEMSGVGIIFNSRIFDSKPEKEK